MPVYEAENSLTENLILNQIVLKIVIQLQWILQNGIIIVESKSYKIYKM